MMRARHRMQRLGVALDQRLGRGVALGDPGALRRAGARPRRTARSRIRRSRAPSAAAAMSRANAASASASPKNSRWSARGTPILRPRRQGGQRRGREGARIGVGGVVAAAPPERRRKASATSRAKIETVSSVRQAGTTPVADSAPSDRLQSDDAVERRRHAARAGRVGAERERRRARRRPRSPSRSSSRRG